MSEPYSPTSSRRVDLVGETTPAVPTESRSIGEILGDVSKDISTLMRQEVALAKAEVTQSASNAGKGIGMFAGAAVGGILFLLFLSTALMWALGGLIGYGWSSLIVAALWAIVAAILASVGKKEMQKIKGVPQTADTVGKIPNALKGQEENNR